MTHDVVVFSPAPRLTITVECPSDHEEVHLHAGGQGVWVTRMVAALDVDGVLCAPFGGETGPVLRALLAGEAFAVEAVGVSTANGAYIHDRRDGDRTLVAEIPASSMSRHDIDDLYGAAIVAGLEGTVTVLTGPAPSEPFPSEPYRRLAADLRSNHRRVIADLSGERLASALEGGVTVVKVSHEELVRDGRAEASTTKGLLDAARALQGAEYVVVSRADAPTLVIGDGRAYMVTAPTVDPLDPHGAGDSMTAGIAAGLSKGQEVLEAVRLGAAAGALNATRRGLGTGDKNHIERLMRLVEIEELTGAMQR